LRFPPSLACCCNIRMFPNTVCGIFEFLVIAQFEACMVRSSRCKNKQWKSPLYWWELILNLQQDKDIQYWGIDINSILHQCQELSIWHMHIPVCFSGQKAPAHSEHRLYGCRYTGMQLLGFNAKFFKGFLSELRHVQLNVRRKILS
jgi:hypothetical protein